MGSAGEAVPPDASPRVFKLNWKTYPEDDDGVLLVDFEELTPGYTGYVKMYSTLKGWGFIISKDVDRDVFLHVRNIESGVPKQSVDSQKGHYIVADFALGYDNRDNPQAFNVRLDHSQENSTDKPWSSWKAESTSNGSKSSWKDERRRDRDEEEDYDKGYKRRVDSRARGDSTVEPLPRKKVKLTEPPEPPPPWSRPGRESKPPLARRTSDHRGEENRHRDEHVDERRDSRRDDDRIADNRRYDRKDPDYRAETRLTLEEHQQQLPKEDWAGSVLEFSVLAGRDAALSLERKEARSIERRVGCRIIVHREVYKRSEEQEIEVLASSGESLRDALTAVIKLASSPVGRLLELKVLLTRPVASSVIGVKGKNVRGINVVTGCRVQVAPCDREDSRQIAVVKGGDVPRLMRVCAIMHGFMDQAKEVGPGAYEQSRVAPPEKPRRDESRRPRRDEQRVAKLRREEARETIASRTSERRSRDQPLPRRTKSSNGLQHHADIAREVELARKLVADDKMMEEEETCGLDPYMQADIDPHSDVGNVPPELTENLPYPWVALPHPDDPGSYYYHNEETGETSWYPPDYMVPETGEAGDDVLSI